MAQNKTQPVSQATLHRLLQECQAQLQAFIKLGSAAGDSESCTEIISHAAKGDETALGMLSTLIIPLIRRKCSNDSRIDVDDTIQDVSVRLLRRLRNQENPYLPSTFAAFRSYLNLTIRSVVVNTIERDTQPNISVDQLQAGQDADPAADSATDAVEEQILLADLLALLPDPLEREALRRRYIYQETPAEIAEALQAQDSTITKAHVYRYVERGMKRLTNHPLVQKIADEEFS